MHLLEKTLAPEKVTTCQSILLISVQGNNWMRRRTTKARAESEYNRDCSAFSGDDESEQY